jgi:hypothetical protein
VGPVSFSPTSRLKAPGRYGRLLHDMIELSVVLMVMLSTVRPWRRS